MGARWRATSPPICKRGGSASTMTISNPMRPGSSSPGRSSMAAHDQCRGRLTAGPTLRRTVELGRRRHQGQGAARRDFFVAIAQGMHQPTRNGSRPGRKPTNTCTRISARRSEGNMVALTRPDVAVRLVRDAAQDRHHQTTACCGSIPSPPAHSIAPGKRPLCNICPVVVAKDGKPWFCIGASGGGASCRGDAAFADADRPWPRCRDGIPSAAHRGLGVGPIRVNRELPDAVKKAIAAGCRSSKSPNQVSPLGFANPCCIVRDPRPASSSA